MAIEAYKISDGKSIYITAGTTYAYGTWYLINGFVGLCCKDAVSGDQVAFNIEEAEYKTDQIVTTETMAVGSKVYWDVSESKFTNTPASTDVECGKVTRAKDASNIIYFKLHSHGAVTA